MDTISREPSPSYLPIAGLIAGLIGLVLGGIALATATKANKAVEAQSEQVAKIETLEGSVTAASSNVDTALSKIASLQSSTQSGFNLVGGELGKTNGELAKVQEAITKLATAAPKLPAKAPGAKSTGPVVAGPDEYVIVKDDSGAKIARAKGISLADLLAVNPGVSWTSLKVGQKIKLPAKK
jgi:LysM repeat protein